jgi:glutathione synthase/RimK-type ligase-like ATP-grasp enzyme
MFTGMLYKENMGEDTCKGIVLQSKNLSFAMRNDEIYPENISTLFRWGCTSNIPENTKAINTAKAIHRVFDKAGFRRIMVEAGGNLCPHTRFDGEEGEMPMVTPMVVRPAHHARGENLYLCHTVPQLLSAVAKCGPGWYASEYINKVAEFRVMIVQGRVAWVAERNPPKQKNKVSWGDGGFYNIRWGNWPLGAIRVSCKAFLLSKLDFGAVDVMVDAEGNAFVSEINTAPQILCVYKQKCVAKCFDYMLDFGKENISLTEEEGNWREYIHPSLSLEARF